jgi:hypothetical protein
MKSIMNLADVYGKLKMYEESDQILKKGLILYPDHTGLQKKRVDLYFAQGDFVRSYVILRSMHGWEKDSSLSMNIRFLENKMKIGNEGISELLPGKLLQNDLARNYTSRILDDPAWLEMIRKKAIKEGKPLREMIRLDAEFMTEQQVSYYQSRIKKDAAWLETIRKKAMNEKKTLEEMIRIDAEFMVYKRFNYYKSMLENDTAALAVLVKKAISGKKSIEVMITAEAEIMVEQDILNGK